MLETFFIAMKKSYLLLFLLLNLNGYSHFTVTPNCKNAYKLIFNLEFEKSRNLLNIEKTIDPTNSIPYLYESYIDLLTVVITENKKQFDKLETNKNIRIKRFEKEDSGSPYFLYSQAEVYLQSAFAKLKFEEYVSGAYELRKAFKLLEENKIKHPNFVQNDKLLGFFHAFIGSVPEQYQWVASFAGFTGTVNQGIKELQNYFIATKKDPDLLYLQDEALGLLIVIQTKVQQDKDKVNLTLGFFKPENSSALLQYVRAITLTRIARSDDAIEVFKNIELTDSQFPFPVLNYQIGVAKLKRLDKDANIYLTKFVNSPNVVTFKKAAYLKLAWYYQIQGNDIMYDKSIENCINKGNESTLNEDIYAKKYALSKQKNEIHLLKARLLFDGGYFTKALSYLKANRTAIPKTKYNSVDYLYRNARCYHMLEDYTNAIIYYKATLKESAGLPYYFACKSALELGRIYEDTKVCKNALYFYKKSLEIPSDEYKDSFTQDAKSGIKRLSDCR